jgi:thymidylate kinase
MKILIFEGIATSGKSTVINLLQSLLNKELKVKVATEHETHIPIMKDTGRLHADFYLKLINKLTLENPDLVIIDRLYLTQAFRAKSSLKPYEKVEMALRPYNTLTIFLRVVPIAIADRIDKATQHRDQEWDSYLRTKGINRQEQAAYYSAQQSSQLELLKQSTLPYKIFDTTEHQYEGIAQEIVDHTGLEPK